MINNDVAIIGINRDAVSETFIRAHVEFLSEGKHYIFRDSGGFGTADGPFVSKSLFFRILGKLPGFKTKFGPEGRFQAYLKKHKISCLLAEYGPTGVQIMGLCKRMKVPFIVHFHGFDASSSKIIEMNGNSYLSLFSEAAGIVAVSQKMVCDLVALGCPKEKITMSPYGPRNGFFDMEPDFSSDTFLSVGRFVEKKAPHLALLAFAQLARQEPKARFIMVGDGVLLGPCNWMATSLGIADKVVFVGARTHEEAMKYFEKAFCFVQHSVVAISGDSEGTPVAVLEAGAAGLPVISTRHAGIPDVIVEEETGILVDEGDVDAMAAAMLRLYRDRSLCAQMGTAARILIREHFSMEKHIGILNDMIEKAILENGK